MKGQSMPELFPIGSLEENEIIVDSKFKKALTGLEETSHIHVFYIDENNRLNTAVEKVDSIDIKSGRIYLSDGFIFNHSRPLIDIKPYYPSEDYVIEANEKSCSEGIEVYSEGNGSYSAEYSGLIRNCNGIAYIETDRIPDNLTRYVKVIWWFNRFEDRKYRNILMCNPPYETEKKIGVFSSRSPVRPNPLAMTIVKIADIDAKKKRIYISDIEAYDNTPVMGILNYDEDNDKVEVTSLPEFAKGWPDHISFKDDNDMTFDTFYIDKKAEETLKRSRKLKSDRRINDNNAQIAERPSYIEVKGARENNLKNLNVTIPYGKITAVVGVSGSGKSSLVMDTVYAECRRRMDYLNSEINSIRSPEVDEVNGAIPTVCISQKEIRANSMSNIGTFTGIYRHLRTIYAAIGDENYRDKDSVKFKITPSSFNFSDPDYRCQKCNGTGYEMKASLEKIITDENKSLLEGASPFLGKLKDFIKNPNANWMKGQVVALSQEMKVDLNMSWKDLPEDFKKLILEGDENRTVCFEYSNLKNGRKGEISRKPEGIIPAINRFYREDSSSAINTKYMEKAICTSCNGERLKAEGRAVGILSVRYPLAAKMTFEELLNFVSLLETELEEDKLLLINEAITRIKELCLAAMELEIEDLSLERRTDEISAGEARRLKLLVAYINHMSGLLYIFDEPSKRLGINEYDCIKKMMKKLINEGNTVLMVEHNVDMIEIADYVIEIGPGAGKNGGYLVGEGKYADLLSHSSTSTARFVKTPLSAAKKNYLPKNEDSILIENVTANNLKNFSGKYYRGALNCITGPSGAGKTTFVNFGIIKDAEARSQFSEIVNIDSKVMAGSSRSVLATYIGIMDEIKDIMASCDSAVLASLTAKDFGFNNGEYRCENCLGEGRIKIPFSNEGYNKCPVCNGRRYSKSNEGVKYKDKSIADILELSVSDAIMFFSENSAVTNKLTAVEKVGLGYLSLGRTTTELSGGEASRLKMSLYLTGKKKNNILYLLDEPTTGLHFSDIDRLLGIIRGLVDEGNTVVAIEHNRQFIDASDFVIKMEKNR